MQTAIFSAQIQELHRMIEWLKNHLLKRKIPSKLIGQLELALEEVAVNVIQHGYRGKSGKIEIGLQWSENQLEIQVRDWGPPFNPLTNPPKVDPSMPLEEREIGGLGIHFLKQLVDEIQYTRELNINVLKLIKRFSQMK